MFVGPVAVLSLLASPALAWLPGVDKHIYARDGTNLFNTTAMGGTSSKRTLPGVDKIRGVNLGNLFVFEPWIANDEWNAMGCGGQKSEFDCVVHLGQAQANAVFQNHWNTWITREDIQKIHDYGLNTIRIPVGYWMLESLPYSDSEHFPQGGFGYLQRVCGWAADLGLYVMIDLHGAPGAQIKENSFTGQFAPAPGFYQPWQYDRAKTFLSWMTTQIHNNNAFRNVGLIELVNEPLQDANAVVSMRRDYYTGGYNAVRSAEQALGVNSNNYLHVQVMNALWGAGNPQEYLTNLWYMSYDDHRYLKWDGNVPWSKQAYLADTCHDDRNKDNNWPTIVGEFSLSVPDNVEWSADWHPDTQKAFYQQWFSAQALKYEEKTNGWIFWTWKSQLNDYRWDYQKAVAQGVIPANPASINRGACNGI